MAEKDQAAKVLLINEDGEAESLWAVSLGSNYYKLDNSPWIVYGLSCHDVIEVYPKESGALPEFIRVVEKSGNRTLRLILDLSAKKSKNSRAVLDNLLDMGCSYEGANPNYFAINIPEEIDFQKVCEFLSKSGHSWEHVDPQYEELYPDE